MGYWFFIKKLPEGGYSYFGKKREKKPHWNFGGPRGLIGNVLIVLAIFWLALDLAAFSPMIDNIIIAIILIIGASLLVVDYLAWKKF